MGPDVVKRGDTHQYSRVSDNQEESVRIIIMFLRFVVQCDSYNNNICLFQGDLKAEHGCGGILARGPRLQHPVFV